MQTVHIGRAIGPGLNPGNTHSKQHGGNATGNSNHKGQPPKTNVPKYPQGSQAKTREHTVQKLWVDRWVDENPVNNGGNGWESYTLSLRIVNWTKAFLSGLDTSEKTLNSLAQQADFLSQDLEKHLLGNHYFVNLKALIFAGCYFEGKEADKWLAIALKGYESELQEQVLSDGGSFELTPMYHVIMLVDLLDLINLFNTYPNKVPNSIVENTYKTALKMLIWLERISHQDNKISFFNDTAFCVAPENEIIIKYAKALQLEWASDSLDEFQVNDLSDTGYVSVKCNEYSLICDLANIGPDYQPAHAHADTLSFEWCLGGQRVIVNSGISQYGDSEERLRQRKLAAHNTVSINGLDSSQVWSGFRVAKRAKILEREVKQSNNSADFFATHDGFKKQGVNCVHKRSWNVTDSIIEITDELFGTFETATGFLHLHPGVAVVNYSKTKVSLQTSEYQINIEFNGAIPEIENSTWHPEFGKVVSNKRIVLNFDKSTVKLCFTWTKYN